MTKLQKIAARRILDCDYSVPSIELFKTLNWQPFEEIVKYNQTLLVYKCLNNSTKLYVRLFCIFQQKLHHITLDHDRRLGAEGSYLTLVRVADRIL